MPGSANSGTVGRPARDVPPDGRYGMAVEHYLRPTVTQRMRDFLGRGAAPEPAGVRVARQASANASEPEPASLSA